MSNKLHQKYGSKTKSEPLAHYLFSYLRDLGVRHCFGIPGDYILPLYKALEETKGIEAVVATHEPCAAFSADAYARLSGLGVFLLTYGVGGFNAMNGIACAQAESSPVLVISGGPPTTSQDHENMFTAHIHHHVKHNNSQMQAFGFIAELTLRIQSRETATTTIRKAASFAMLAKKPVYLEIPVDMLTLPIPVDYEEIDEKQVDLGALDQAVDYFLERINLAKNPVIIAGVEISRYSLQEPIRYIMAARNIPLAMSILGKGTFNETDPGILGVYAGVLSQPLSIRKPIEDSDLIILLGMKVTDVNCGAFTAHLHKDRLLIAKNGWVGDAYKRFSVPIPMVPFVTSLAEKISPQKKTSAWPQKPASPSPQNQTLMDQYLECIDSHLMDNNIVIADTGDSCYGSLSMKIKRDNGYMAPTFYNTMGFAIPAALGAQLADPSIRPLVLVGDGAFQMTGMELSNLVKRNLNPIILLFNNNGYGMQRMFVNGDFNNIQRWNYSRIVDLVGGGKSWTVKSVKEMHKAIQEALNFTHGPSLIETIVPADDISTILQTFKKAFQREKSGVCPLASHDTSCQHQDHCPFCRALIWEQT